MNLTSSLPVTKFVFHTHKPKADMIAEAFQAGCRRLSYDCMICKDTTPRPGRVGIFYGVVPETFAAFSFYKADKRAIYLDNGWLWTPEINTLRFSWNSVQPFLRDMPIKDRWTKFFGPLPKIERRPVPGQALLVLQSRQYFDNLRLGFSRDVWERSVTRLLHGKGYAVTSREKPKKKGEGVSLFEQLETAEIVVALNSAVIVKALRYGIPAFSMIDSTPSPLAPMRIPDPGRAAPPDPSAVARMCAQMASYELNMEELRSSHGVERILSVKPEKRRGLWYSKDV